MAVAGSTLAFLNLALLVLLMPVLKQVALVQQLSTLTAVPAKVVLSQQVSAPGPAWA